MMHRFSWRIGIAVIILILAIFALLYPNILKNQNVPIRQKSEIRTDNTQDDTAARDAINKEQ